MIARGMADHTREKMGRTIKEQGPKMATKYLYLDIQHFRIIIL